MFLGLSRAYFLSPTGQCKTFDVSADGYSRAEGCGLFVLKRLKDAKNENDRIHGVIKATEVNQSGNARSITHPDQNTQLGLYKRLLSRASIHPHSISVIEMHGTGTQVRKSTDCGATYRGLIKNRQEIVLRLQASTRYLDTDELAPSLCI